MTTYISPNTGRNIVRLLIVCLMLMLLIVAYVFRAGYDGRQDLVKVQRAGCERGKLDRRANATGWKTAEKRATSQGQLGFAETYSKIAAELEARSKISCTKAFPDASLIP